MLTGAMYAVVVGGCQSMIKPQEFERRRFAKVKFIIDLIFILLLLALVAYVNEADANTGDVERVGAYVSKFLKNVPQRRARALELIPIVVSDPVPRILTRCWLQF